MKKILFASTALIATASVAAAELTWSGSGRFGLVYDSGSAPKSILDHRFRLTVNGVTETDSGVKFEGRIRFEANDGAGSGVYGSDSAGAHGAARGTIGGAGFAVSTGGLRVDVGHVSDVFDSGDVISWGGNGVGYTGFLDQAAAFQNFDKNGFGAGSTNTQIIKARYTAGDFTGSASYRFDDTSLAGKDEGWQIGAGYSFGAHKVGAMYGDDKATGKQWAIGANGAFGDFSYAVLVGDNDVENKTMYGLSGAYAVSAATSITGFVSGGGTTAAKTAYGLGVSHSLGGGVSLGAGIAKDIDGDSRGDAGVTFSF